MSGDGGAKTGGRFNRKGDATLYLALDIVTAVNECTQGLSQRLQPLTICEYDVDCDPIADLRTETARAVLGITLDQLDCAWLTCMLDGHEAPSWRVVDALKKDGFAGILVPSFAPRAASEVGGGSYNLILWRWGARLPTRVAVYDPNRRLPKDQKSWRA